jgi:hypothetical protein
MCISRHKITKPLKGTETDYWLNEEQVCTGVMLHGYGHVKQLCTELKSFMEKHKFQTIDDFRG